MSDAYSIPVGLLASAAWIGVKRLSVIAGFGILSWSGVEVGLSARHAREHDVLEVGTAKALACSPDGKTILLATGSTLIRSLDGGATWSVVLPQQQGGAAPAAAPQPPQVAAAPAPAPTPKAVGQ